MGEKAQKYRGGRKLIFKTPEELQAVIDEYFNGNNKPTLAGLAVALKIDRQTLYNYKDRDDFHEIIMDATSRVEAVYEENMIYNRDTNVVGLVFALKNMGWSDRQDINQQTELSGSVQITGMEIK